MTEANRQLLTCPDRGPPQGEIAGISRQSEAILSEGEAVIPPAPPSGKWGGTYQSFPLNLPRRLCYYPNAVLWFTCDPRVPFSNNRAEQAMSHLGVRLTHRRAQLMARAA